MKGEGVFGTFQVFPSVRVHFAPLLTWDEVFRTSTDVVRGGVHHRYEDTTYIVNVYE